MDVLTKDVHRTVTHVRLIVGQSGILFLYFWKVLIETSSLSQSYSVLKEPTSTNQFKGFLEGNALHSTRVKSNIPGISKGDMTSYYVVLT